jgi:hypothetical protein
MSTEREREQYRIGYRRGIRRAVAWLHERAKEMNDPHAVALLNTAGFNLGVDLNQGRLGVSAHEPEPNGSRTCAAGKPGSFLSPTRRSTASRTMTRAQCPR